MDTAAYYAGRFVARCLHPFATWTVGSIPTRCSIVAGYAAGAYVVTFIGLRLASF